MKVISIPEQNLADLLARRTGNPIAEEDTPQRLRDAIRSGDVVILTDIYGKDSVRLQLDGENFVYLPIDRG
jgi:hypothetical protein